MRSPSAVRESLLPTLQSGPVVLRLEPVRLRWRRVLVGGRGGNVVVGVIVGVSVGVGAAVGVLVAVGVGVGVG